MANGSLTVNGGKKVMLHRAYTPNGSLSATEFLVATKFKMGVSNDTPSVGDTDLDVAIPITDGTVNDDGSNTLTGSTGGDNSTDNTVTFKQGAGQVDVTAQNLIANDTNVLKIWTIANLSAVGANAVGTKPFGLWLYIHDAAALAKFKSAGTALEIKLGKDTGNYYSLTKTAADLATGWNWITSNTVNVEDLNETGTVDAALDTFIIEITTNNSTDEFTTGDVIYDLLRQWETNDLIKSFISGFPTIDLVNFEAQTKVVINTTEANGFFVNGLGIFNEDTSPIMTDEDTFTGESKSNTDEINFVITNRLL